jgi:hypothetical protein
VHFADIESSDPILQEDLQTRTAQHADELLKTNLATNDGQENNPRYPQVRKKCEIANTIQGQGLTLRVMFEAE